MSIKAGIRQEADSAFSQARRRVFFQRKRQLEAEARNTKTGERKARGTIAVFSSGSAPAGDEVLHQAERLGRLLAEAGFALISGGYFVVLKGGIGTLTEATLTWSLLQTGQISPRPFIFVGESWRHLFEAFRAETFMQEHDFSLAALVDSVDRAVALLLEGLAPAP